MHRHTIKAIWQQLRVSEIGTILYIYTCPTSVCVCVCAVVVCKVYYTGPY